MSTDTNRAGTSPEAALIDRVLAERRSGNPGWLAAVRSGITPATEAASLGSTSAYLAPITSPTAVAGARRAAAITAACTGSAQVDGKRLGASLSELHRAQTGTRPGSASNSITSQVNTLPMLDVENAALVFSALLGRCSDEHIGIDFRQLASTLRWWGNGITPASRRTRESIVRDYYSA